MGVAISSSMFNAGGGLLLQSSFMSVVGSDEIGVWAVEGWGGIAISFIVGVATHADPRTAAPSPPPFSHFASCRKIASCHNNEHCLYILERHRCMAPMRNDILSYLSYYHIIYIYI